MISVGCVVGISLSRETMESAPGFSQGLSCSPVLWVYRPILDRQALLQLLQTKSMLGFEDTDANAETHQ